jgi:hypothetical protein
MGDYLRQKGGPRTSSRGSNNGHNYASSQGNREFFPRADFEVQILTSPSPVSSAKDTCSWLEKKGWMLSSENYSKNKLAEILLSVSLSFKLPTEADTAVSNKIIGRVIEELKKPVSKLNESITAAKSFLDTTSQQQASELINLRDSVKQHSDLAKTLADFSDKLSQVTTGNLDDASWPLLSPSGPPDSRPH